jgi:hypothetical protein
MANHVTSRIQLVEGNRRVTEWVEALFVNMEAPEEDQQGYHSMFKPVHMMFNNWDSEEDPDTYGWYIDNIGAKWCHIEDCTDDSMMFESAWGYPGALFQRIAEEAYAIDPDCIFSITYEDEMPNFFGSGLYADGEMYDEEYWDEENYKYHNLKFFWNEEEDGPEPDDFDTSESYEKIWDIQCEDIKGMIEGYKEYKAEQNASD